MLYGHLVPKNLVVMMVLTPALLVTALMKMMNCRVSPDIVATSTTRTCHQGSSDTSSKETVV